MWGLRRQVSFLRAQGHPEAGDYAVAQVWEEVDIAAARQNAMLASGVGLLQMTVGSLLSKDAAKALKETIEGLTDGQE